ncbi:hypothetical protein HYFRA_00009604 [Hymenoscyphus fraxineus]|uniref:Uncharacterized protein n=1 Tax=Hymenoscyphus fraxineus TaxID=746836 RepID=A0A9N9L0U7_9HELO|nr:hypothetical protein HYFRA_00009604 [Hymenoscyphus fraxineus]
MAADKDKREQYYENIDSLCKSTPRFAFWGNLLPDSIIPFFNPPLIYKGDNGADTDLSKVIDDPAHPWDKGAFSSPQRLGKPKRQKTRVQRRSSTHDQSHLIVTEQDTNVIEVCESGTSYGWDIVSTSQNVFCDMEHKQLYPLCSETITTKCFDLMNKTLLGGPGLNQRDEEVQKLRFGRSYNSTALWKN